MKPKRDNTTVLLTLKILAEPLTGRVCSCGTPDFRQVVNTLRTHTARCADCGYNSTAKPCGRVVQFVIGSDYERVTRCGDTLDGSSCTDDSQSSMPLAVCLTCNRLVALL